MGWSCGGPFQVDHAGVKTAAKVDKWARLDHHGRELAGAPGSFTWWFGRPRGMGNSERPKLWEWAKKLPYTVHHNRADSTVKKYFPAYKWWKN